MGWKAFENGCYKFFYPQKHNWQSAEYDCNKYGGHLASIHSDEERDFIRWIGMRDGFLWRTWIGGRRVGSQLLWTDGSNFDEYHCWEKNEPNHQGFPNGTIDVYEDCVELLPERNHTNPCEPLRWNDSWCNDEKHYVCKAQNRGNEMY